MVKRYYTNVKDSEMFVGADGPFVMFTDYAGLAATYIEHAKRADLSEGRLAQLEAALASVRRYFDERAYPDVHYLVKIVDAALHPTASETKVCTCDSTLVTDTSEHQPHCPQAKIGAKP